mgnify:CR=1 FL=1
METDTLEQPAVEAVDVPEERTNTLIYADRCDSCGAQAYVGLLFETGELLFCAHHFNRFESKLRNTAVKIFDERWKLTDERLDVSA